MDILIKEIDKLILGDGRPFNSGENTFRIHFNEILNIPVYSLLKNTVEQEPKIEFIGIVRNKKYIMFPFPLDIFYKLVYKYNRFYLEPLSKEKIKEYKYLNLRMCKKYLKNEKIDNLKDTLKNNAYENLFNINFKVGIQLDRRTRITEKSKLYFESFYYLANNKNLNNKLKLTDYYIYVRLNKDVNLQYKLGLLGGETQLIRLEKPEQDLIRKNFEKKLEDDIKTEIKKTKHFKIILLTPTNSPPEIEGAKPIAQLTGKPIAFSGWFNIYEDKYNLNSKKLDSFPSRLFKLIPAGSVFYYKLEDESKLEEIFRKYWLKPSFFVPEYPYFEKTEDDTNPLGFGLSIIGVAQVEE